MNKVFDMQETLEKAGVLFPKYDRKQVIANTKDKPTWLHLGAGNIFRAFPAVLQQRLLDQNEIEVGLIVAEGYDDEIIDKVYHDNENINIVATLMNNGEINYRIVTSVVEALKLERTATDDFARLHEIVSSESLQMISFTITEKAYDIYDPSGSLLKALAEDVIRPLDEAKSYLGKVVSLLYQRYQNGGYPITLVSMDNCANNGDRLKSALTTLIKLWVDNNILPSAFLDYVAEEKTVSFPLTMIDKITPRPEQVIVDRLKDMGVTDIETAVTTKGTYIAPFVNAEELEYLVIEDCFANGRPPLEKVGVLFCDRNTVKQVESMKVTTCLNPLHTALAIFGCLLDYSYIYQTISDPELLILVKQLGYKEGLPVVVDPQVINPKEFLDSVINIRLTNPHLPDTPQRIATDTSLKIPVRFMETYKHYLNDDNLSTTNLRAIPLIIAGWLRYLVGINDRGHEFTVSPDPYLKTIEVDLNEIGQLPTDDYREFVEKILRNEMIFTVDFVKSEMAERIITLFNRMMAKPGAVREVLIQETKLMKTE